MIFFPATREGERTAARVPHLHSADLPRSHGRDCPLTRSNEIILGEVMLKMNHFLTIPRRRHRHISPGPCGWKPFILQHRAGRGLHSSQAKPRASPPALETKAHDRKLPSNPITTRSTPAAAFLKEILGYYDSFLVWLLTHLRPEFHPKLLQPRSSYCLAREQSIVGDERIAAL